MQLPPVRAHCDACAAASSSTWNSAVLAGSLDGFLRVFNAATGELLFQYDTARSFDTVNGIPGKGGAIDNASIVAANGYVFLNSGYGLLGGQTPGNVFLAFRPRKSHEPQEPTEAVACVSSLPRTHHRSCLR